jgi:hypothetical protein
MKGLKLMEGYIKISRAILNHPALNKRDRTYCEVGAWLWILLEASFAERDFTIGTQTVRLRRGEFCHSVSYMAEAWGWSQPKTRHYLDKLVKFNSILFVKPEGKSADFPNIVKVLNYDDYQDGIGKSDVKPHGNKHNKIINKDIIYIDEFNKIWEKLTAKRGSKKVAYQKWSKIKTKVTPEKLIDSYNRIVKKASSIEFIPHFSTFLSQERWLDEDVIVKEKAITPEQFFRKRFPKIIPDGFIMVSHSWTEITFSNGKQQLTFDYRTGKQI